MSEDGCYSWEEVYRAYGCSPVYLAEERGDGPRAPPRSVPHQLQGRATGDLVESVYLPKMRTAPRASVSTA